MEHIKNDFGLEILLNHHVRAIAFLRGLEADNYIDALPISSGKFKSIIYPNIPEK